MHVFSRRSVPVCEASSISTWTNDATAAAPSPAVYSLTKHGVGAFTEALRQEVTSRHVRVSLIEPGPVATELFTHIRPEVLAASKDAFADATLLHAEDIADTIAFVVTRPARVVMSELLVRPDGSQW